MSKNQPLVDWVFDRLCELTAPLRQSTLNSGKIMSPPTLGDIDTEHFVMRRRMALRNLERKGLVQLMYHRGYIGVRLTAAGKHERLLREVTIQQKKLPRENFCYVVFDIPETRRIARRAFVRFLKAAQFIKLQKSVWRTDRDVRREIRELVRIHRAESMIKVIIGKELA